MESFTILTTAPNAEMSGIHSRMPVILQPSDYDLWLNPEAANDQIEPLLKGLPDGSLDASRANKAVGNVRIDEPWLTDTGDGPQGELI